VGGAVADQQGPRSIGSEEINGNIAFTVAAKKKGSPISKAAVSQTQNRLPLPRPLPKPKPVGSANGAGAGEVPRCDGQHALAVAAFDAAIDLAKSKRFLLSEALSVRGRVLAAKGSGEGHGCHWDEHITSDMRKQQLEEVMGRMQGPRELLEKLMRGAWLIWMGVLAQGRGADALVAEHASVCGWVSATAQNGQVLWCCSSRWRCCRRQRVDMPFATKRAEAGGVDDARQLAARA
jgi:hypothetical protein